MNEPVNSGSASVVTAKISGRAVQALPVVVADVHMPFASMVGFIVKWTIAAIPALIILFVVFVFLGTLLGGVFSSFIRH